MKRNFMGNTVLGLRISNSPGSEEKNKVKPCQHSIYNFFSNSINTFLLKKKKSRFHCWKTTYSIIICKTGNHDSEALIFCYILSFCFLVTFLFTKEDFFLGDWNSWMIHWFYCVSYLLFCIWIRHNLRWVLLRWSGDCRTRGTE